MELKKRERCKYIEIENKTVVTMGKVWERLRNGRCMSEDMKVPYAG